MAALDKIKKKPTLDGLQGLRGFAAILVVCDHATSILNSKSGSDADVGFGWFLGNFGVQIFFVISGLTMMLAHGQAFQKPGESTSFAAKRIGRIVPFYWLMSIGYWLKGVASHKAAPLAALLLSLLFIPHQEAGQRFGDPVLGQGWTLEFEMFFYLMFAIALLAPRTIGLIALAMFFIGLSATYLAGLFPAKTAISYIAQPITLFFIAGIGIGVIRAMLAKRNAYPWGFWTAVASSAICVAGSVAVGIVLGASSPIAVAVCTLASVASVAVCGLARPESLTSLSRSFARGLGDATFAIYLTHTLVVAIAATLVSKIFHHVPQAPFIVVMIPVCVLVGSAAYRWVDKPMSKFATKKLLALTVP